MSIGLVITAFNEQRRPGLLERACELALDDRIDELVIQHDSPDDDPNSVAELFESLARRFKEKTNKIFVWFSPNNLGVFGAKLQAIRNAKSDWLLSCDSDNCFGVDALDVLCGEERNPNYIYAPSFAMPHFDYREKAGETITLANFDKLCSWNRFPCVLNSGNSMFNRVAMLDVFDGWPVENFQARQPDYFGVGSSITERKWRLVYDSADSYFFNKVWLQSGKSIYLAPNLTYLHSVHASSSWQAAPPEKDFLPTIYALEILDSSRGESASYRIEGSYIEQMRRLMILLRTCGTRKTRMWVTVEMPSIVRIQEL